MKRTIRIKEMGKFVFIIVVVLILSACSSGKKEVTENNSRDTSIVKIPDSSDVKTFRVKIPEKHHLYLFFFAEDNSSGQIQKIRKQVADAGLSPGNIKFQMRGREKVKAYFITEVKDVEDTIRMNEIISEYEGKTKNEGQKSFFYLKDLNFPDGKKNLQDIGSPVVRHLHFNEGKENYWHLKHPELIDPEKSFFTKSNCDSFYFFMARQNSSFLNIEDPENNLLGFLRLKNSLDSIQYKMIVDVEEDIGNPSPVLRLKFKNLKSYLIGGDKLRACNILSWQKSVDGDAGKWKNARADLETNNVKYFMGDIDVPGPYEHYYCLPGIIPLKGKIPSDWKNWSVKEIAYSDSKNRKRNGKAIDLNKDGINDIFWFSEQFPSHGGIEHVAWMYVNVEGKWVLKHYDSVTRN